MIDPEDPGTIDLLDGMVRKPDHETSIKAARGVRRFTLREIVEQYARDCGRSGFTDEDLKLMQPPRPESSLRKRRTELAQENIVLETGRTRTNDFAQQEKVWVHRDFHPSPPPIQERDTTPKQSRLARAEATIADLLVALKPFSKVSDRPITEDDLITAERAYARATTCN
jgi:hypothetical protein